MYEEMVLKICSYSYDDCDAFDTGDCENDLKWEACGDLIAFEDDELLEYVKLKDGKVIFNYEDLYIEKECSFSQIKEVKLDVKFNYEHLDVKEEDMTLDFSYFDDFMPIEESTQENKEVREILEKCAPDCVYTKKIKINVHLIIIGK